MNRYEKDEIRSLPPKYRPMGAWGYVGYTILYGIPLIGLIMLIVFACSGSNIARRSHARSYFCFMLLGLIIIGIFIGILIGAGMMDEIIQTIRDFISQMQPQ